MSLIFHQKCSYLLLQSHKGSFRVSGVVPSCPSPSETNDLKLGINNLELSSNASGESGSRLISDDTQYQEIDIRATHVS